MNGVHHILSPGADSRWEGIPQRRQVEPNSMWQHRLTQPLHTAYGNSQTNLFLNYFKRGSTLNLNGFSVKIFFFHKILGIFEFFLSVVVNSRVNLWENLPKILI